METKNICPICGEPTRTYMGNARKDKLCGKHADMLKSGLIKVNDDGLFVDTKNNRILNINNQSSEEKVTKCIVCGAETTKGFLCRDCYYEMKDYMDSFDKNKPSFEFRDYYYNLKQNIFRMRTFDYVKSNCNKLIALANITKNVHNDTSLSDRVVMDVEELIATKKPKEETPNLPESFTKDSQKEELIRTEDGHRVKSQGESIIDDILYEQRIVHCYEKKVPIDMDEQAIMCDWYIPILDTRRGVFIEYWGMSTKEYLENKKRKQEAYKRHNVPIIQIEKDECKDKQALADRIIQEINKIAKEVYGIDNYIKLY